MNDIVTGVVAYKALDHYLTSADARLADQTRRDQLEYLQKRDQEFRDMQSAQFQDSMIASRNLARYAQEAERERAYESRAASREQQLHERLMQDMENEVRKEIAEANNATARYVADVQADALARQAEAKVYIADRDREAELAMHARQLDQNEQLELRRLRVQQNIADQSEALQRYLSEQSIKSAHELERFKALAMRETQILMSRENAINQLQSSLVHEAMKSFPLNISPIVLLQNRPHALTGLLRFSSTLTSESGLPSVIQVYNDVKAYSANPEALNIFIAPIHIDSRIQNRELLSQQIWDTIYLHVERFFTNYYNRTSPHPVILYPTAWKDNNDSGQHASETLHFFLKDIPSLVIEPRFDGHSFSLMLSMWGLGYASYEHVRLEMHFDVNIEAMLIQSAYKRSVKSLNIINELGDKVSTILADKKEELTRNVEYYESLDLGSRLSANDLDDISAIGVYNLFSIDPVQDMAEASKMISDLLCSNLAVLTDIHHLQATDTPPIFPCLFKTNFNDLYENIEFRETVAKCYERVYVMLRNIDSAGLDMVHKREMERVREIQITNLKKQLELISDEQAKESILDKVRKYASDKYGINVESEEELWNSVINKIEVEDISFFSELLPNIEDRRLYKRIDRRISELTH